MQDDRPQRAATRAKRPLLFVALAVALCGCPSSEETDRDPQPSISLSGVEVHLIVPEGSSLRETATISVSEWEASTGGICHVEEVKLSGASGGLANVPRESVLLVAPLTLVPELVHSGWIAPFDEQSSPEAIAMWNDVLGGLQKGVARPGGRPGLIPVSCPVLACYYRSDLLEAAGKRPPETWDEYQSLLETMDEWAPGGAAVEPWGEEFRTTMFLARAVSAALHPDSLSLFLDVEAGQPLIGSEPFVRALEDSQAALAHLDEQSLTFGPGDCVRELIDGRAVLAIGYPQLAQDDDGSRASAVSATGENGAQIGICMLPGTTSVFDRENNEWMQTGEAAGPQRVTLVGFTGYAVCVSSHATDQTRRAAWNLWRAIDDDLAATGKPAEWSLGVCRAGRIGEATRLQFAELPRSVWRGHVQAASQQLSSTRVVAELPLPERERFRALLTDQITNVLTGGAAPQAALSQAADDWDALIESTGRERVVNTYRACIGLAPLVER